MLFVTDHCVPNPCRNAGTCVKSSSGYNCTCPLGFVGLHCEKGWLATYLPVHLYCTCPSQNFQLFFGSRFPVCSRIFFFFFVREFWLHMSVFFRGISPIPFPSSRSTTCDLGFWSRYWCPELAGYVKLKLHHLSRAPVQH